MSAIQFQKENPRLLQIMGELHMINKTYNKRKLATMTQDEKDKLVSHVEDLKNEIKAI